MQPAQPEEWRNVIGYKGLYEVSNLGRVKRIKNGKILKLDANISGYWYVKLWKDGTRTGHRVHKLVALAFIGPKPDAHEISHKDNDGFNNNADNLEYLTHSANQLATMRAATRCKYGHDFTGNRYAGGQCKTCAAAYRKGGLAYQIKLFGLH